MADRDPAEVRADLALALEVLAELRDKGGCLVGTGGSCHTHWRFSPDGLWKCPHQRAARLLDKYADQARDERTT